MQPPSPGSSGADTATAAGPKRGGKRKKFFRRLRIAALVLFFLLVCAALYLNRVGLPGFVKKPLLAKLRARGIELQVNRLRWSWARGIVADNVTFTSTNEVLSPKLSLRQIQLRLNPRSLATLNFQITSLMLRRGEFRWPTSTNVAPGPIRANNIEAELRFLPNDCWSLENFSAEFAGAKLALSGSVTNATSIRQLFQPKARKRPGRLRTRLDEFARTLEHIKFSSPPELRVVVEGDARDAQSFHGTVTLRAPDANTPWGKVSEGLFIARVFQDETNDITRADVQMEAAGVEMHRPDCAAHGNARGLRLSAQLSSSANDTNLFSGNLTLQAHHAEVEWNAGTNVHFISATNVQLAANCVQAATSAVPVSGHADLQLNDVRMKWGTAARAHLAIDFNNFRHEPSADKDLSWWTNLWPFAFQWQCELAKVESPKLQAQELICSGDWLAPEVRVKSIHSKLYGGQLDASAGLNAATRSVQFNFTSDFDAQKISPLLTAGGRRWIQRFSWGKPPKVMGSGRVVLPAWTNKHPDWRAEVQPTLVLNGEFSAEHGGAYKGAPVSSARSHISYSNMVWTLPDLALTRPEGGAELFHISDDRTKDYYWKIHAAIDPKALRPLLNTNAQRGLDHFEFTSVPVVDGELWGRYRDYDRTSFRGHAALSNFTFRGESVSAFETALALTNNFLRFLEPKLSRKSVDGAGQQMTASGIGLDLKTKQLFFTNGFSTADPMVVARGIGKRTAKNFAPYQFLKAPTVYAHGMIQLRPKGQPDLADMEFHVDGGAFHWNKFTATHIAGTLFWRDDWLTLTNVQAEAYGGTASGHAAFDVSPRPGTDFHFDVRARDLDFHSLMMDVSERTNNLQGSLTGRLAITNATSNDLQSWNGFGRAHLRDGLLWDIPMFGIFSPVLNAIWPGLGNSRASEASGKFIITNSVVFTDDLQIEAQSMRMNYRGTVDFNQNVNARVEAEMLRNVWGIGPIFSTIFWPMTKMFEYKVTGTLGRPNSEPLYLFPKLLLFPLHPIKTMKGVFSDRTDTNGPPTAPKLETPKEQKEP